MRRIGLLLLGVALLASGRTVAAATEVATKLAVVPQPASPAEVVRLIFAMHRRDVPKQTRAGDDLVLRPAVVPLPPAAAKVPVEVQVGQTVIHLPPGASVTSSRLPGRLFLVVDLPPRAGVSTPTAVASAETTHGSTGVLPGLPAPMVAVVDAPPPAMSPAPKRSAVEPSTVVQASADAPSSPVSIEASLVKQEGDAASSLLLPFDRTVGAAAFLRGDRLEIVFDRRKPIDLSASVSDPLFHQARLSLLPSGTLLDMPWDPARPMALGRTEGGWALRVVPSSLHPVTPDRRTDGLLFATGDAGEVLTVPDPAGGGEILVGTVRSDTRYVATAARAPGYAVIPTLLGVAAERFSDRVELRAIEGGFRLIDPFPPVGSGRPEGADFSRSVELPPVDQAEWWRRYEDALAISAASTPGSRRAPRLDAATAALALGLGRETRLLAQVADADSANGVGRQRSAFLSGAGALMADDADASRLLADPALGNSDETVLWRNLAAARQDPSDRSAVRAIVKLWPLLLSYPEPVRRALLGDAALALVAAGDDVSRALVTRLQGEGGKIGLARARAAAVTDGGKLAVPMLDRLGLDRDPEVVLAAAMDSIELRLRDKQFAPEEAARRMETLIYDGRMAGQETQVALRAAALWGEAGNAKKALGLLREQATAAPDRLPEIRRIAGAIIVPAVDPAAPNQNPLDAVALLDENEDLLPPDADRVGISTRLADRLVKAELPGRATGFLRRAFEQAPAGSDKTTLGLALAATLLSQDDQTGARTILSTMDDNQLTSAQRDCKLLLEARLLSAGGDRDGALAMLASSPEQDALEMRASLLGEKKDWRGEADVLQALLAERRSNGPGIGRGLDKGLENDPGQATARLDAGTEDLVLRLAGALSRSQQGEAVRTLAGTWSDAFADPGKRDMLRLLASPDVLSVGDLPRSASDLTTARGALKGLSGGGAG